MAGEAILMVVESAAKFSIILNAAPPSLSIQAWTHGCPWRRNCPARGSGLFFNFCGKGGKSPITSLDLDSSICSFQNFGRIDDRGEFFVQVAQSRAMDRFGGPLRSVQGGSREGRSRIGNHVRFEP